MIGEDLSPFLSTDEFASEVLLDDGSTVTGIFDDAYELVNSGMGISSTAPAVGMASADVPDEPVDQRVVIKGQAYVVVGAEPDGAGWTMLILELAA